MRKNLRCVISTLFVVVLGARPENTVADTIVGGMITSDTTWALAGSPYIATESVLVMDGAVLTIEPGVIVKFDPARALSITDGTLVAQGTAGSNILFTASQSPPDTATNRWGYIGFWDNAVDASTDGQGGYIGGCILQHAVVEYAGGAATDGAIVVEASSPLIVDCKVWRNARGGILVRHAPAITIENNNVSENQGCGVLVAWAAAGSMIVDNAVSSNLGEFRGGIYVHVSDNILVDGNRVSNNFGENGGGIGIASSDNALLRQNTVVQNTGDRGGGIRVQSSQGVQVVGNWISNNIAAEGAGISLDDADNCTLTENVVFANVATEGGGMMIEEAYQATFNQNIFQGNIATNGGGIFLSQCWEAQFSGDKIIENGAVTGSGMLISGGGAYKLSKSAFQATQIFGNVGRHQLHNNCVYQGSSEPEGSGNIDGRNVWWGTTNTTEIRAMIYDFFDDAGKGIVFYSPFVTPADYASNPAVAGLGYSNGCYVIGSTSLTEGSLLTLEVCHDLMSNDWASVTGAIITAENPTPDWVVPVDTNESAAFYRLRGSEWMLGW